MIFDKEKLQKGIDMRDKIYLLNTLDEETIDIFLHRKRSESLLYENRKKLNKIDDMKTFITEWLESSHLYDLFDLFRQCMNKLEMNNEADTGEKTYADPYITEYVNRLKRGY